MTVSLPNHSVVFDQKTGQSQAQQKRSERLRGFDETLRPCEMSEARHPEAQ